GKKFDSRTLNVVSRIKEAQIIAKSQLATSMIDSSDGLVRSILEICRASKVGARINSDLVPIATRATLEQALYGGEEYELVFTIRNKQANRVNELQKKMKVKLSVVGEIIGEGNGIKLADKNGKEKDVKCGGYEHFR
ncbi:MAG: AIR synthase-related protein, partial [Candidatus Margulisbacteria bacterium]|nr:AIR synthase-related protein [Candidatus Margulisiibacteriota bacterium]